MEQVCELHQLSVISICFMKGCSRIFMCRRCIKEHPDDHDPSIQDVCILSSNDKWIIPIEEQKNKQIDEIETVYKQKKDCVISENVAIVRECVDSLINILQKKENEWIKELNNLIDLESLGVSSNLQNYIKTLKDYTFKGENVFESVKRTKIFQEEIISKSSHLMQQAEIFFKGINLDMSKVNKYKNEMIELVDRINIKSLFPHKPFRSILKEEELALLQEKYDKFEQDKANEIQSLNEELKKFQTNNGLLTKELNELSEKYVILKETMAASKFYSNSGILTPEYLSMLKEWLPESPNFNKRQKQLNLSLLYKGSRDGFTCKSFNTKCDKISDTISLIKTKQYGRIIGGYTTKSWKYDGYVKDKDAFIFSLTNKEKYPCIDPEKAIYKSGKYIFSFGGGNDLVLLEPVG